ncbi:MAG TPA: glutamine--fructose-6-phosphate transaminase (isomerizing) [Solirubrobacteraceae bacterium]|nr:glutamine--fructose-6-phosphate transaminase (isomerizing) [Solirubrobacteraceae bacterium]
MCGITSYVGQRPADELLLAGLEQLEYRGYDSAGIALMSDSGHTQTVRAVGNLAALRAAVAERALVLAVVGTGGHHPTTGIGHTRWATHGGVTEANAHPHADSDEQIHIVLNGIIENHVELRRRMAAEGATIRSETDAEVVAHLIAHYDDGDLIDAVRRALGDVRGHYAVVAMSAAQPGLLVAARQECPLVVGAADDEHFIASAIPAFLAHTREVHQVVDGELVVATADAVQFLDAAHGRWHRRPTATIDWEHDVAVKGAYEAFMLKEIDEQPAAVSATLAGRLNAHGSVLDDDSLGFDERQLGDLQSVRIVACGSSYHAGLLGRYLIEEWARLPVELDIASEYRYRNPVRARGEMLLGITQSGETADTLAAMRLARRRGATVLAITNVMGSQATRDADGVLFTRAGTEVGVAATKTFTAQVIALALLALKLGQLRGTLTAARAGELAGELMRLPGLFADAVAGAADWAAAAAKQWAAFDFCMFLGRHAGLPIALEGALKLKEVSYIPCEAYAAGEMKHGPIALLSSGTPVVCVATDSPVLEKLLSNIAEVRARGAHVLAIAGARRAEVAEYADEVFGVPVTDALLQPLLAVVPLQLLAYHVARVRGLNVDQPRNLAKTVTVE